MSSQKVTISGIKYTISYKIGQGQQGSVYCVQSPKGQMFALKKMDIINENFRERMYREITLHHSCKCPNIIKFIDSEEIDGELYIILELGQCNLSTFLETKQGKTLNQKELFMLIRDIACGLVEVHKNQIIHRDIKADNIILKDDIFKISDFGVSGEGAQKQTFIGTPIYLAPEVLSNRINGNNYNYLVDIWALGVISFEAYFGVHPFYHNPKDKHAMNFASLTDSMNAIIDSSGFSIEKLVQKLRREGLLNEAKKIQDKIKVTPTQSLIVLRNFWNKSITIDPRVRIGAEAVYHMFSSAQRVSLLNEQVIQHHHKPKGNTINTGWNNPHSTKNSFQNSIPSHNKAYNSYSQQSLPQLQKAQSYNPQTPPAYLGNSRFSEMEQRNRRFSGSNLNEEQLQRHTKHVPLNPSDFQNFITNTKIMVVQLSTSYNSVMTIKQIKYLNYCLTALEMITIMCINKGSLSAQDLAKFKKMDRREKQKTISKTLKQAAVLYNDLVDKYPMHQFLAQMVFRLQLCAIIPRFSENSEKLMHCLPQLLPTKQGFGELDKTQNYIQVSNYQYFIAQLKSLDRK